MTAVVEIELADVAAGVGADNVAAAGGRQEMFAGHWSCQLACFAGTLGTHLAVGLPCSCGTVARQQLG